MSYGRDEPRTEVTSACHFRKGALPGAQYSGLCFRFSLSLFQVRATLACQRATQSFSSSSV